MAKYIKREDAVFAACKVLDKFGGCKMGELCPDVGCAEVRDIVDQYICKDVVDRDEGIRIGAELAAMHGSDATSQELEKAYFDGVEEGWRKARKTGKWVVQDTAHEYCSECWKIYTVDSLFMVGVNDEPNFCPNCGARMVPEDDEA